MKVLVTGAKGFIGRNLCASLINIRDGKDRRERYQPLLPLEVLEFDRDCDPAALAGMCEQADFVFNLAGVNRPEREEEFMAGNFGFASELLEQLERAGNTCPVVLSSSAQASLQGRFAGSAYGKSKLAGEELFRAYGQRTGADVLIYRFPNVYGKWCRPNYNSAVATFCHNIARELPITVNDESVVLELLYVDDLVNEMLAALLGEPTRGEDGLCHAGPTDSVSLGRIVGMLRDFRAARAECRVPNVAGGSFAKKLLSTYESYLPPDDLSYPLAVNADDRGSFIEFLRTPDRGQVSINISRPGITKGQHWHHSKWEKFCVVAGEGLVLQRRIGRDGQGRPHPVVEYRVSGASPQVVEVIPGYTHNLVNLSDTEDLVTIVWANEPFDPDEPDTYREEV